jgi:hypothetical protein
MIAEMRVLALLLGDERKKSKAPLRERKEEMLRSPTLTVASLEITFQIRLASKRRGFVA